jgi:hypothetical protein
MDEQEKIKGDTVHQHDNYWWFWDETWSTRLGPYPSHEEAEMALSRHAMSHLDGQVELTVWVNDEELELIKEAAIANRMRVSHWCKYTLLHNAKIKTKHPLWTGDNLY